MDIEVIFEDESLIVVNKPNNMLVYPSYFARNIKEKSLIEHLQEQVDNKLYPIHRLDYKTSGVIMMGKNSESVRQVQIQFEEGTTEKTYKALLRGHTSISGKVDTPVKNPDTGKYKEAYTEYFTLSLIEIPKAIPPFNTSRYSLVNLSPKTGRMHQLRKHMNKISHPIIGDHRYGDRHHNRLFSELLLPNMFLHAEDLRMNHPITKTP